MPADRQDIHWPLLGIDRRYGYQNSPTHLYSCPDSLNVRNADVFERRLRGGSRPGLAQILPPRASEEDDPDGDDVVVNGPIEFVPTKDVVIRRHDNTFSQDDKNTDWGIPKGNNVSICGSSVSINLGRSLFHFDLTNVPTGATFTEVTFLNRGYTATAGDVGELMWARRLTQTGWSETYRSDYPTGPYGTTSWTRYDYNNTLSWATAGGDYTTDDQAEWALGPYPSGDFSITGLAAMAQEALDNQGKQLHIILMRQDEGVNLARIVGYQFMNSREWGLSFPTQGPRLSVIYTTPAP